MPTLTETINNHPVSIFGGAILVTIAGTIGTLSALGMINGPGDEGTPTEDDVVASACESITQDDVLFNNSLPSASVELPLRISWQPKNCALGVQVHQDGKVVFPETAPQQFQAPGVVVPLEAGQSYTAKLRTPQGKAPFLSHPFRVKDSVRPPPDRPPDPKPRPTCDEMVPIDLAAGKLRPHWGEFGGTCRRDGDALVLKVTNRQGNWGMCCLDYRKGVIDARSAVGVCAEVDASQDEQGVEAKLEVADTGKQILVVRADVSAKRTLREFKDFEDDQRLFAFNRVCVVATGKTGKLPATIRLKKMGLVGE